MFEQTNLPSSEHDKGVREHNVQPARLVFVYILPLEFAVNTDEGVEVVEVGVSFEVIRMAVMSVRVLVLPNNGIAQQAHSPNANVIDKRSTAGREVPGIVAQRSKKPPKNGKQKAPGNTSLKRKRRNIRRCQ